MVATTAMLIGGMPELRWRMHASSVRLLRAIALVLALISVLTEPVICHWRCQSSNQQASLPQLAPALTLHPSEVTLTAEHHADPAALRQASEYQFLAGTPVQDPTSDPPGVFAHHDHQGRIPVPTLALIAFSDEEPALARAAAPPLGSAHQLLRPPITP